MDLQLLIKEMLSQLIYNPDDIVINMKKKSTSTIIEVLTKTEPVHSKIIGKDGCIANAMRSYLAAVGVHKKHYYVYRIRRFQDKK